MERPTGHEASSEPRRPASVGPEALKRSSSTSSLKPMNRNSMSSSQIAANDEYEKRGTSKGRGRVSKVVGDLFLLAGNLPGAIAHFTQSVEILRLTTDYVWHGSALEGIGMAILVLKFLGLEFSVMLSLLMLMKKVPTILQTTILSPPIYHDAGRTTPRITTEELQSTSDLSTDSFPAQSLVEILPETHSQILHLYQRSLTSSSVDAVPSACFPDHIIRLARLLTDVYISGDLDELTLKANVLGEPIKTLPPSARTSPPRGDIARWAMKAWNHLVTDETILPISYRINVMVALVQVMGRIEFHRRRALLIYEMLHLIVPRLVQARVLGAAEWGMHPSAALIFTPRISGDSSLSELFYPLTAVYGATPISDEENLSGWALLKADILRQCIAVSEALPDPAHVASLTALLLALGRDTVDKDEQIRLAGNLPRATAAGKRKGLVVEARYWDKFVVQNIEFAE